MKIITDINQIHFQDLEQFVYNHPHGNFFQSTQAYQFFKTIDNYEPIFIVAKEKDEIVGSLLAVCIREGKGIKGYFSRRCIIWGGPVVKDNEPAIISALLAELNIQVSSKTIYTEFRNLFNTENFKLIFLRHGFNYVEWFNFIIDLNSIDDPKKLLNKTRRWEINKSIKEGVSLFEAETLNQVKQFYLILKDLYKQKVKKPLPDFSFFEQFFFSQDLGKYFLLKFEDKIIGGTMCPIYKDKIYEWYECGLDKEYKNIYPSSLATWAPIEYAAKNGLKYFDFMGAGKPDEDYGVREFKSKFGGKEVRYGRYLKINNKLLYNVGKLWLRIFK